MWLPVWSEELLIGVEEIDRQHRELLLTLSGFMEALGNPQTSREYYRTTMEQTKALVIEHFNTEEKHFGEIGFTEAEYHTELHKSFFEKATDFDIELIKTDYDPEVALRLVEMLIAWFTEHIRCEDRKMADPVFWSGREETPRFQL
ncbi:hemerythrin domain-containing protein [Ruminococcaceae bacterium OttesenSCG-928-I18]|nr:hemerythrin domain-containing protein [Ruminococcaceae bacterium OttesenSCG-928-I18]